MDERIFLSDLDFKSRVYKINLSQYLTKSSKVNGMSRVAVFVIDTQLITVCFMLKWCLIRPMCIKIGL